MKKTFIYSFVVVFPVLLVSCGVFAKNQNSTYKTQLDTSGTAPTTEIVKGQGLKGAQFNAVDEQGRKLNFEIKNVEPDPKDPKNKPIFTQYFISIQQILNGRICVLLMPRMSPRQFR
jgi:hypothetical protein